MLVGGTRHALPSLTHTETTMRLHVGAERRTPMSKTILITGCSSGFGKLTASLFLEKGWNVIATMRSPEKETELENGDRLLLTKLDVADPASITAAFEAGRDRFGTIDAVVNNAGIGGNGIFEQFSDADTRAMFEVNVYGPMNVMREALPMMRNAGQGVIVNVTSMAGHVPVPGSAVYAASKHAATGLTEAVALEYKPLGIRVFEVAPGSYPSTRFNASSDRRFEIGDEQLVRFSKKQGTHLQAKSEQMGESADPREVAEKIFACVTSDNMPINNPTGSDAEMFAAMLSQGDRQAFLEQIGAMAVPDFNE